MELREQMRLLEERGFSEMERVPEWARAEHMEISTPLEELWKYEKNGRGMKKIVILIVIIVVILIGAILFTSSPNESFPGPEVAVLVNLRGDETTAYKLADGTYMDRVVMRFTFNGTDTWMDENGVDWNEKVEY